MVIIGHFYFGLTLFCVNLSPAYSVKHGGGGKMKKITVFAGLMVLVFAVACFSGTPAKCPDKGKGNPAEQGKPGDRPSLDKVKTNCPECAALADQLKAKLDEIKVLMDQAKAEREAKKAERDAKKAEREKKLADLKAKNPDKYNKMMEKMAENKKDKGNKPQKTKEEKLQELKEKNPEKYAELMKIKQLREEAKALRKQLQDCVKANKQNKKENKEKK